MKNTIKDLFLKIKSISSLDTIEEKSFWVTAPTIAFLGLAGLGTAGFYESSLPTIISAIMCLIIPIVLMVIVYKNNNYHYAYPLLCIFTGGLSIPFTFVTSGGFLSGMPLFCVITTAITALCYEKRWRFISLFACLIGNTIAFVYVYIFGSPFPLLTMGTTDYATVYNDILFGYYCSAVGMFVCISFITGDIRKYKLNQEALQKFFDGEVRNEILRNALNDDLSKVGDHKKAVILFADISNFTPITEKMNPELITSFLNEFFSLAGKHIHETGGIIDKYIGDCVMAYWFELEENNCVLAAVRSMIELKMELYSNAEMIHQKYGTELNFSAGISYGDVIFGDIGSDTMHDYTVIGDAVNIASRIQHFAVGGELLISNNAAEQIKGLVTLENVELNHFFKGKNKSVDIYRIIGLADKKTAAIPHGEVIHGYQLNICGCRGSFPVSGLRFSEYGGETSCYVIKKEDYAVVVDCGTGLKNAVEILKDCQNIDILLTHVHYDHILGFLMSKFPPTAKIRIFGRFKDWSDSPYTLEEFMEHPYWPVDIVNMEKVDISLDTEIALGHEVTAQFHHSNHPDNACVIEMKLQEKKVVFLADCEDANVLDPAISEGADLLFFDGMFDDNDEVSHKGWGHGTWQDGVRFFRSRNIRKMVITHHNPEIGDHTLMLKETEAREMEPNVSFARSGDIFEL